MISKKRLEKLIDEWAIIYTTNRDKVVCCALDNKMYCDEEILYLENKDYIEITNINDFDHNKLFFAEKNKENYILACRKAKELFLGECDD